jgi:hypothetical protein
VEQQQQYVGIDLHRRRSVIVRRTPDGETLETVRIDNDPVVLAAELAKAGEHPEVVLEATYGWILLWMSRPSGERFSYHSSLKCQATSPEELASIPTSRQKTSLAT